MSTLYFITSNKGKVLEASEKFKALNVDIVQKNIGYPEIQSETLEQVAHYGVIHLRNSGISHAFILEDAGIFIDALHGFPGVYSSYVYHTIGLQGILALLEETKTRSARFKSVISYAKDNDDPLFFIGECEGSISITGRGSQGFGYDPIFIPKGSTETFGEMTTRKKNTLSHRGKSLDKLYDFLKEKKDL
jgi:XTP/dITP diphosphohydrolase